LAQLSDDSNGQRSKNPTSEESAREHWVRSTEARKELKLSTCELAHLRETGKIESKKVGNAYYYKLDRKHERTDEH